MGLLGNKGESILNQEVKEEEGKQLAKDNGFEFAINSNKEPVFCEFLEKLVKKYIEINIEEEEENKGKKLKVEKKKSANKKKKCL